MTTRLAIQLWGSTIGAAQWLPDRGIAVFQYTKRFAKSGIELSPLQMPPTVEPYEFPNLPASTFFGLPGLLEDSLPDRYGSHVMNVHFTMNGRIADQVTPLGRLGEIENSGMGALTFVDERKRSKPKTFALDMADLAALARRLAASQNTIIDTPKNDQDDLQREMIRAGMYAGGAKPKAVVLYNQETDEFRTQGDKAPEGFTPWLIKFDNGPDGPNGADLWQFGRIEYAYHLMAKDAGIEMSDCRLWSVGDKRHFMTRRFDRLKGDERLHMQSLGALAHYDYNQPGAYSYEQGLQAARRLGLPREDFEQFVLRAFFNILARNQDDHVKNIAFLMDRSGQWRLSPAFDMMFAYSPNNRWTRIHQMSLAGKLDGFEVNDLYDFAAAADFKRNTARALIDKVRNALSRWHDHAASAELSDELVDRISRNFRSQLVEVDSGMRHKSGGHPHPSGKKSL